MQGTKRAWLFASVSWAWKRDASASSRRVSGRSASVAAAHTALATFCGTNADSWASASASSGASSVVSSGRASCERSLLLSGVCSQNL